jgi:hypothetical protein
MYELAVVAGYLAAALVNAVPAVAVVSRARLEDLYGVPVVTAELELLLRHRALLFGVVAAWLVLAAWRPELRVIAGALALVSMLGWVVLAALTGAGSPLLDRVTRVDLVASGLLGAALVAQLLRGTSATS